MSSNTNHFYGSNTTPIPANLYQFATSSFSVIARAWTHTHLDGQHRNNTLFRRFAGAQGNDI